MVVPRPPPQENKEPPEPDPMQGVNMPNSAVMKLAKHTHQQPMKAGTNPSGTQKIQLLVEFELVDSKYCEQFTWDDPCDFGFEFAKHVIDDSTTDKVGDEPVQEIWFEFTDSLKGVKRSELTNRKDTIDSIACRNHCDRFATLMNLGPMPPKPPKGAEPGASAGDQDTHPFFLG